MDVLDQQHTKTFIFTVIQSVLQEDYFMSRITNGFPTNLLH